MFFVVFRSSWSQRIGWCRKVSSSCIGEKSEKLKMCADYKVHVKNECITEIRSLLCIETIFSKTSDTK